MRFTLIGILLCSNILMAQHRTIDSINNIPYEIKVAKAAILDDVFLKNASDSKKTKYVLGEADSYSNLGLVYYYQGKYGQNVDFMLKAIKLYESVGAKDKQASEYANLGYSMKRRNMQKAQYYMQKGKLIAEAGNLTLPLMAIYDNYGVLKEMQKQLDSALFFYNKSLSFKQKAKDSLGIPYSLNNIGGIYAMKNQFDLAEKMYSQSLQIRILRKDSIGMAENFTSLGDLYFVQKSYPTAIDFYKKSLELSLKHRYLFLIQSNYKSIADSYELLKNPIEAFANYKKHSQYKDSLLNKETNSKIAELEIQFDTNKKEKLLAENKNQLLEKAAEVKERTVLLIGVSILTIFIGLVGFLIFRQQKLKNRQLKQEHELKNAISQIETQNKLHDQRLSISRDLHDNIGAQLTFIISSVDNIKYAFDITNSKLDHKLSSISNFTKETILELRDTIWAMNNSEISFEDLRARILNFIEKAKEVRESIQFTFSIDDNLNVLKLTSVQGMNIYRTIQESVNNALKYAEANEIVIDIVRQENNINITIRDDGSGFDMENVMLGNGISNMRKRISDIGGIFKIQSIPGKGTEINIVLDKIIA